MGACASKEELKRIKDDLERLVENTEANDVAHKKAVQKLGDLEDAWISFGQNLSSDLRETQADVGKEMDDMISKKLLGCASKQDVKHIVESIDGMINESDAIQLKKLKGLAEELHSLHSEVGEEISHKLDMCASKADLKRVEGHIEENNTDQHKSLKKVMEEIHTLQSGLGSLDETMSHKLDICASKSDLKRVEEHLEEGGEDIHRDLKKIVESMNNLQSEFGTMDEMIAHKLEICAHKTDLRRIEENLKDNDCENKRHLTKLAQEVHVLQSEIGSMDEVVCKKVVESMDKCMSPKIAQASEAQMQKMEQHFHTVNAKNEEDTLAQTTRSENLTQDLKTLQQLIGLMDKNVVVMSSQMVESTENKMQILADRIQNTIFSMMEKKDQEHAAHAQKHTEELQDLQSELKLIEPMVCQKIAETSELQMKSVEGHFQNVLEKQEAVGTKLQDVITQELHAHQDEIRSIEPMVSQKIAETSELQMKLEEARFQNVLEKQEALETNLQDVITQEFQTHQNEIRSIESLVSQKIAETSELQMKSAEGNFENVLAKHEAVETNLQNFITQELQAHQNELRSIESMVSQKIAETSELQMKSIEGNFQNVLEKHEAVETKLQDVITQELQAHQDEIKSIEPMVSKKIAETSELQMKSVEDHFHNVLDKHEAVEATLQDFITKELQAHQHEVAQTLQQELSAKVIGAMEAMMVGMSSTIVGASEAHMNLLKERVQSIIDNDKDLTQDLKVELHKVKEEFGAMKATMKEMVAEKLIASMTEVMNGVSSKIVAAEKAQIQLMEQHIQTMIGKKEESDNDLKGELKALQAEVAKDLKSSTSSIEMTLSKGAEALKTNELIMESHMKQMQEQTKAALNLVRKEIMLKQNEITRHKRVIRTQSEKMGAITSIFNNTAPQVHKVIQEAHQCALDDDMGEITGVDLADDLAIANCAPVSDLLAIED